MGYFFWFLPRFRLNEMAILSKVCKPYNFESYNSLKFSFTSIRDFVLISLDVNLSLSQTLLIFLLYMRQTWNTQSTLAIYLWVDAFPYCQLFYSITQMHGLAVYVKDGLSFEWDLFRKLWGFLFIFLICFIYYHLLLCAQFKNRPIWKYICLWRRHNIRTDCQFWWNWYTCWVLS